jgi:transposase-like protein
MAGKRPAKQKRGSQKQRPQDRSAQEKLQLLMEVGKLTDEELGGFLRREGIHEADLEQWRETAIDGLSGKVTSAATAGQASKRIRDLEKQLRRKDKALAEAGALLVLQKKVREIWGDEDDDT